MQSRSYCWTLFEYESGEYVAGLFEECEWVKYSIHQEEKCPETDRRHLQGYSEFTGPIRIGRFKRLVGDTVHVERRRGSRDQAREYCQKEETRMSGPWEKGEFQKSGQGSRTDLSAVKRALDDGQGEGEIADEFFGAWCRYHKAFRAYKQLRLEPRTWKTNFEIHWGLPGTGKTRHVYDKYGHSAVYDLPRPNGGSVWFDGYDAEKHTVLLLDDFYGWVPLHMLLKWTDRYGLRVPIKGGMCQFLFKHVYITSNKPMGEWYDWDRFDGGGSLRLALERRVDKTTHYDRLVEFEE